MTRGWWRTNRWWLVAMVVALAALAVLTWRSDSVRNWWEINPHRAHQADAEGWAQVGDVRYRAVGFERVDSVDDGFDGQIVAPDGYTLWSADLSARSDLPLPKGEEPEPTYSCTSQLRDSAGRVYDVGASALSGMPLADDLICTGPVSARYTQYFLTPDDAVPVELRVVDTTLLPAYWSLPVSPAEAAGSGPSTATD